jgi:acyl-coenzyme A synthetase/AMP-(fatty) acid ligase
MHLFSAAPANSTLLWHNGAAICRAGFAQAALQLAARLPDAAHCINLCDGRLSFMLGLIAATLRRQTTLLPPNQTNTALLLLQQHPRCHVLNDSCLAGLDWNGALRPDIHIDEVEALLVLYTSGSTGVSQPHAKTWGTLAHTGRLDAARFAGQQALNLVGTVPAQHMFGLQTLVLMPLMSSCAIHDSKPFFPADIRGALDEIPAPRALITSPLHLRACLAADVNFPALQFILSATAALPLQLAQEAEARWHTQVLEIYGSTEAGTIGTRRTTAGENWQLIPGARLLQHEGGIRLQAAHVSQTLMLSDHVELISSREFRLLGRAGDQIKIAGKRAALGDLTCALQSVTGVVDGVVFLPPDAVRTAALVVAPTMKAAQILDALAQLVDPVFLPRPLLMVPQLPRNEVGKITQGDLLTVLESHPANPNTCRSQS